MPTTEFSIAASGDDGYVQGTDTVYPPASGSFADSGEGSLWLTKTLNAGDYTIGVVLIRWDTSSLTDDATVTAATLRIYVSSRSDANGRNLTADWYDAGTITTADYTTTVGTNAHAGTAMSSLTESADNDLILTNVSNVSLTGYTGVRLHVSGGAPTGTTQLILPSLDHATLTEPRLIVTYTDNEPPPPTPKLFVARSNVRW